MADIRIDKEGKWFYRGAEMIRRDIIRYFYEHLKMDKNGQYRIEIPGDSCDIEVEDTAFVIKSVDVRDGEIVLSLSDDSEEKLDPASLFIGKDNVLYCRVKRGTFPARFNRASYYQLAAYLAHDEKAGYYLTLGEKRFYLSFHKS